jgi:uncharacterized protein DUF6297
MARSWRAALPATRSAACGDDVTAAPEAVELPDTTDATFALLRELRTRHLRARAANLAFWLYFIGLLVFSYGGWLVADIVHSLRRPPPPLASTPELLRAAPASLCVLGLILLVALLWDARWRGPVTVSRPTAEWLLSTPVSRSRLLRPRYRASVAKAVAAGVAAGFVPVALLLAAGLGGADLGHSLRLAAVTLTSTALLAGLGTGVAAAVEAGVLRRTRPGPSGLGRGRFGRGRFELGRFGPSGLGLGRFGLGRFGLGRRVLAAPVWTALAVLALVGLAAAGAAVRLPAVVATIILWSGPWGWSAQGPLALAGGSAPLWPVALGLLAVAAAGAIVAGDRAAAAVPAAALRARARTLGDMSAAVYNLDARRVAVAYRGATVTSGRARFALRPPHRRWLVLPWRDLTALIRAPSRLAWSVLLSLAAVGLGALAAHTPSAGLLPLTAALGVGYLAASGLCEGARLDGDDARRSGQLPFPYRELVWWHAIVPCLVLAVLAGGPAAALAVAAGHERLLFPLAATIAVLVGGALVNGYRGQLEGEMFNGFDTALGNSSGVSITLWYVTGPMLAIAPMIVLWHIALDSKKPGGIVAATLLAVALAAWLGSIAANRATRLKSA